MCVNAEMDIETLSESKCFGGTQGIYRHVSREIGLPMRVAVYRPPQAARGAVPILLYLSGLTCTEENFTLKAGAQRLAAQYGFLLVVPDTSPRDTGIAGERDDWAFGAGAGFYLDATVAPWSRYFRMESYVTRELLAWVCRNFPGDGARQSVFGHSVGGHGALTLALKNPGMFASVSALAPMTSPIHSELGRKALAGYLGDDRAAWRKYDACALVEDGHRCPAILIDQGTEDHVLSEMQPHRFERACAEAGQPVTLNMRDGYDHGYYFVQSFVADHFAHHAESLQR